MPEVSGVVNTPKLGLPTVLVRDPAGQSRGVKPIMARWSWIALLRVQPQLSNAFRS